MGNEYFEAKGVSRGEFEALKRFGDYEQLSDGTLMRMEGDKEFRIYCEDSGWLIAGSDGPGVIVTRGFGKMLEEAHNRQMKDPEYQKDPKGYIRRIQKEYDERAAQWRAKWRPAENLSGS